MRLYEEVRKTNSRLLNNILTSKGSIQVCCRTRPVLKNEIGEGKICVDVIDDTELACYDRRNEQWRSFAFDKVWPVDVSQVSYNKPSNTFNTNIQAC